MSVPRNLSLEPEVARTVVDVGSGELAALIAEPPVDAPRRPAALLVPGYSGSKEDFLPVLAPLARAGHRAVAIDLRGQYQSPGPDDPNAYSLDALAKDVADVLADLATAEHGPAHLVGHSFGGLVTRRAILNGATPRSHTLAGSGPAALGGARAEIVSLILSTLDDGGPAAIADASAALDRQDPRMAGIPPEVTAFLHERWVSGSPTALRVMGRELTSAPDEVDALAAVGLPTLVMYGAADDTWSPQEQQAMARRLGAADVSIPGSVHSPACEQPEAFVAALLRFWSVVDSRGSATGSE